MSKHLVIVVHGIGEQVAGETVDQFCTAAIRSMAETDHKNDARNLKLFPCFTRRVKSKPTDSNQEPDETVFAEVY